MEETSCSEMHRLLVQAAFKRNPLGSNSKAEAGFLDGSLPSQVEDWDAVKAEDKTLVHQVDIYV